MRVIMTFNKPLYTYISNDTKVLLVDEYLTGGKNIDELVEKYIYGN